ncbi:MAG: T9SS type A sorting domain-containing protein [Chitinophagaceae bacterium]|nr:T9SS type A sorting domain-containing protein [Chitinophagaceae bacterium]
MKIIKHLFIISLFFFSFQTFSQTNIGFQWQRTLFGTKASRGNAIIKTSDGGFAILGSSDSSQGDLWVGKFNRTGAFEWEKNYGGISNVVSQDIKQTSDNGYVIVSSFNAVGLVSGYKGGGDYWVIKLDSIGNLKWQRFLGGSGNDSPTSILEANDGGIVIAGVTTSTNGDVIGKTDSLNLDVWIVKINNIGSTILWQKLYLGSKREEVSDMKKAVNGDLLITGLSNSNDNDFTGNGDGDNNKFDMFIIRLSANGNTIWKKMSRNTGDDNGSSLIELPNNSIVVGGSVYVNNLNAATGWIVKLASDGTNLWERKVYNIGTADTFLISFSQMVYNPVDGGLMLSGFASWYNYVESATVIKADSLGNPLWRRTFSNSTFMSEFNDMILNEDLTVTATGNHYINYNPRSNPVLLCRIGPVNQLKGTLFLDANTNGIKDAGELNFNNTLVKTQKGSNFVIAQPQNGAFRFDIDTGAYTTTVQLFNPYYNVVPSLKNTNYTTYFNVDSFGFAVQPIPNKQDLIVHLIPGTPARPGFQSSYVLNYKNTGTTTIASGTVKFIKDSRTAFIASIPLPVSVVADTVTWNYTNLKPLDSVSVGIQLQIAAPPTVNINDTLKLMATILPVSGDLTPADDTSRLRQRVIGSYDPNDKQESFAGRIPLKNVQDGSYINYIIRFQNTGNDTAFFVRLLDTLDSKLDWNSFQMIGSSHAYNLTIKDGNKLNWFFDNIKLPDSTTNFNRSIGYVAFRIKPKNTLVANDVVSNKASIYFDYNLPIITNIANTIVTVETTTGVREVQNNEMKLVLGPNPSSGYSVLQISGKLTGKFELRIMDNSGRIISQQTITRNSIAETLQLPLNLQQLASGVYYIQLQQKEKSWWQKVVVQ